MNTPVPPLPAAARRFRFGTVGKMMGLGALVLLLLIPLGMVRGVLSERMNRRNEAVREVTSTWGESQNLVGPVLIVPYRYHFKTWKERIVNDRVEKLEVAETAVAKAYFLPAELEVEGKLDPRVLHRGIYPVIVYSGNVRIQGRFDPPDFEEWKVAPEDILWEEAQVALGVTDLRGAQESLVLNWGGREIALLPGSPIPSYSAGVHARLRESGAIAESRPFSAEISLNGSRGIWFAPVGRSNQVNLTSPWPDPSFSGAFLPAEREVSAKGFKALWKVSYYGRSYPQQWSSKDSSGAFDSTKVAASLFGVDLISVLDAYRTVERSIKYGILFIVMIFTAFFLFEVLAPLRVHPFQYTLVGFALCLFYLALLSLSEFVGFGAAYAAGAAASTLMITGYSGRVLRSARRALVIGGAMAAVFGLLFVILRLQDYALLVGTAGLFVALAIVMYATRRIDWYARDEGASAPP
jgi:inner membrane protein